MCIGSKSSGSQATPAPTPPTSFDYTSANRNQARADGSVSQAQAAKTISTTGSFGSELGNPAATGAM